MSLNAQCSAAGEPVYQCAKVGLRSFSPLDSQTCPGNNNSNSDLMMPSIQEKTCDKDGNVVMDTSDFQFPSWDELPEDFQNPTSSADFDSSIPITSAEFGMVMDDGGDGSGLMWDNEEMNFQMDLDGDMDLELNVLGKC
jgi:hypothetical protein